MNESTLIRSAGTLFRIARTLDQTRGQMAPINTSARITSIAALAGFCTTTNAQWSAVTFYLGGATYPLAGSGAHVVGTASGHAFIADASSLAWIDLSPIGSTGAAAQAASGNQQVGYANLDGFTHAGLWNGTAASWVSLHPAAAMESVALATTGTQQGGYVSFPGMQHAALWSGTPESWVDLNPLGANQSAVDSISGSQQVGYAQFGDFTHAVLWSGTAESWVDLSPAGALQAGASGIAGDQEVGGVAFNPDHQADYHAGIWRGTATSFVDLHPTGAQSSEARATTGSWQVGFVEFYYGEFAAIWHGTADSVQYLQAPLLMGGWSWYAATNIWIDGPVTYVVGYGQNLFDGSYHGILWTYRCYPNCDGSTTPPALNVNDFLCFQTKFAAGDTYANCDGSTTPPILNVNDFLCFQQKFSASCP